MKVTLISLIGAVVLIVGALMLTSSSGDTKQVSNANNVRVVDGKQIIEINAKGGYQPRKSVARAEIPTIIRFNTRGTFDCSSFVRIPSMNISKSLPQTGSIDIDIGNGKPGILRGSCGMGMYPFEVEFQKNL